MWRVVPIACAIALQLLPRTTPAETTGVRFANPMRQHWQVGAVVEARGATCTGIVAAVTIPRPWPEQQVRIVGKEATSHVKSVRYRTYDDSVTQMLVTIPRLTGRQTAKVKLTLEITKSAVVGPEQTGGYSVPVQLTRDLQKYLEPSPYIESDDDKIASVAAEAVDRSQGGWRQVESIYDWVRAKVRYEFDEKLKGARTALESGVGDCEELTSLFIAMCRANKIPARAVWVPGHCYPEFYLTDQQGNGHWFPCQAAGGRQFGSISELRPILQKGDSFRVPGQREPVRYVAETLSAKNAPVPPAVEFFRRPVRRLMLQ